MLVTQAEVIFWGEMRRKKKKKEGHNGHRLALQMPENADQKASQLESMSFGLHCDIRDGSFVFPEAELELLGADHNLGVLLHL